MGSDPVRVISRELGDLWHVGMILALLASVTRHDGEYDEARALPVRVQLLAIDSPVCTEENIGHACPRWPSALAVGQRALALIAQPRGKAEAVVHFDPADGDVEIAPLDSSNLQEPRFIPATRAAPRHVETTDPALLPSRCLQDARNLLKNLITPNRNQEPSSP